MGGRHLFYSLKMGVNIYFIAWKWRQTFILQPENGGRHLFYSLKMEADIYFIAWKWRQTFILYPEKWRRTFPPRDLKVYNHHATLQNTVKPLTPVFWDMMFRPWVIVSRRFEGPKRPRRISVTGGCVNM